MDRRQFVLATSAALLAPTAALADGLRKDVFILAVMARDCPFCIEWNAYERARLERLCREARVRFREVEVLRFTDIREDGAWPSDLKPVLAKIPYTDGTPRFLVVHEGRIIQHTVGLEQYRRGILPMFV
ncbi:hypothetical protein [uncultured Alsobacter sp.]|uniref:hypothetical protein n=1 Tax=uncultured Alsobacter sp. TaxID=1748258 RepID=UPI0025CD287A|nr:hypothetical protein [uncultured Alsobacter sp.]